MKKYLVKYFDLIALPLALLIWWYSSAITRWIDPTAGVDDAGFIQHLLLKFVAFLLITVFIKVYMRFCWSTVNVYLRDTWVLAFNKLTSWEKVLITSLLFCAFLLALAIL